MRRALVLTTLLAVMCGAAFAQTPGVLHIKVTLTDAAGTPIPIARHALLISDNPSTTSPRRAVTRADGTADVRLPPGNYTVESDEPLTFNGKSYQWTQTLDVRAGRDAALALTAGNAEIGAAVATAASPAAALENDPSLLLPQWKDSVVSVWTPVSRGSGFIVSSQGLVVTNQRVVGSASAVEVQLTPTVKVGARVLAADRARDVAVLWIDPAILAMVRPIPMGCADGAKPPLTDRQKLVAFGTPLRGEKDWTFADAATFRLDPGSSGGPVFDAVGAVVGLSSLVDEQDDVRRRDRHAHIVPIANACEVVKSAEQAMQTTARPAAMRLPTEPLRPFPADVLDAEVTRRVGSLNPYQTTSPDFDIAFLTPVLVKGAKNPDFGEWADYFADDPPVLAVRVTPKMVESFWTTVARGAAYTQGAALPAIKHFKPGFSRLRVLCGDVEVTPIHPFIVERRVSETDATREGLYVFGPEALGPHCASVTLVLSSEKAPDKTDTRTVDPKVIDRIWQDFAPYRP